MIVSPNKDNHLLLIPGQLGGGNFAKLSSFPGFTKWQDRNLVLRVTGQNIQHIMNHWPDAEWIGGCEAIKIAHLRMLGLAKDVAEAKINPAILPDDSGYTYKRKPMDHQRKAFGLSRDRKAFGLFMEQGTGKTKVIIDTACYLWNKKEIDFLVIVAWPNGVHRNWVDYELPVDMSVPYVAEYWSSNHNTKHKSLAYRELLMQKDKLRVFSFNVEAFVSEAAQKMLLTILHSNRCMLAIDQSASIKNPQALRTKFLVDEASELAAYRRVLDGAPVAEGASELYSQFKFLDPMIIGHDTWTGFRAEFCDVGYFNEIKGYKNLDQLHQRIDGHCYRVLAQDCQDLPPRIYTRWSFDLTANEERIFNELKTQDLAFFKGGVASSVGEEDGDGEPTEIIEEHLALVKNLRLQQISSGWWPGEDLKQIEKTKSSRLQALEQMLAQIKGKVLIFSRFRADLDAIAKLLGEEAVSYHGGIGEEERATAKRRFMTDDAVRYFIGQPRSAGIGHTLTAASHVVFYSNDPSLRMREECEKRVHRTGLKHKVVVWDMIARQSHDCAILRALKEKKNLSDVILRDPANFFLEHE